LIEDEGAEEMAVLGVDPEPPDISEKEVKEGGLAVELDEAAGPPPRAAAAAAAAAVVELVVVFSRDREENEKLFDHSLKL
jgi:hypothetical protein